MARSSLQTPFDSQASRAPSSWRRDRGFWLLLVLATALGLAYNAVIMPGFGPDEPRHMAYVRLLLDERRLPIELNGVEYAGAHAGHPPLYYILLVPFFAIGRLLPGDASWHVLRLVSLALCLISLPLVHQIAQKARGEEGGPWFARLVVAQVGLLPLFGMTAGIINNDSALLLAVTVFLWLLIVRFPREQSLKSAAVIGACLGLGALCKGTALICDGVALVIYLGLQNGRGGWKLARTWQRLGIALAVAAVFAVPWYGRNVAIYKAYQPIPVGYTNGALPAPSNGMLIMAAHPKFPALFGQANWGIFYTLWAQRDWLGQTQVPTRGTPPLQPTQRAVYLALLAYTLLATAGHIRRKLRGRKRARDGEEGGSDERFDERLSVWICLGAFIATWAACLQIALFVHWGQAEGGRYLLPALIGLSLFLARGWRFLVGERGLQVLVPMWCAFALALNVGSMFWLLFYLNPLFGPAK